MRAGNLFWFLRFAKSDSSILEWRRDVYSLKWTAGITSGLLVLLEIRSNGWLLTIVRRLFRTMLCCGRFIRGTLLEMFPV